MDIRKGGDRIGYDLSNGSEPWSLDERMDLPWDCYPLSSLAADPRTHSPRPVPVSNRRAWQRTARLSSVHKDSRPVGIFATGRKDNQ